MNYVCWLAIYSKARAFQGQGQRIPRPRINIPVLEAVETVKKHIFSSRTDESFHRLFEATAHSAAELELEPMVLPRNATGKESHQIVIQDRLWHTSIRQQKSTIHGQEFLVSGCYSPAAWWQIWSRKYRAAQVGLLQVTEHPAYWRSWPWSLIQRWMMHQHNLKLNWECFAIKTNIAPQQKLFK